MEKRSNERTAKFIFWGVIALILIISYLILKNFIIALAAAFILAYLLKPMNDAFAKKMPKQVAAMLSIFIIIIIIAAIFSIIVGSLVSEVSAILNRDIVNDVIKNIESLPYGEVIKANLSGIIAKGSSLLIDIVYSWLTEVPTKLILVFVTLFTTYYLLIDWDGIKKRINDVLPFKNKNQVINQMERVIEDIIAGTFLIALLEAAIAISVFWLLGVKYAVLLGSLIGIFAFIPAMGPFLIWGPTAIVYFANGNYPVALGIVIMGIVISFLVDNLLRLKVVGKKTNIHPVVMLLGIFGGIKLFGALGFILGPLILSILITIVDNIPKMEVD